MKKILLAIFSVIASVSMNAQVVNEFKNGIYEQTFTNENGAKVVLNSSTATVKKADGTTTKEYSAADGYSFQFRKGNLLGSGTAADPYIVSDYTDLYLMSIKALDTKGQSAYYKQTADIDCAGRPLIPIGTYTIPFKGTYDGQNHTISNANYQTFTDNSDWGKDICALFGVTQNVTIKNLKIATPTFNITNDNRTMLVSPLIGWAFGTKNSITTITNCLADVIWTGNKKIADGWYGYNYDGKTLSYGGMIAYCSSNADISKCAHSGKIVGFAKTNYAFGGIIGEAEPVDGSDRSSLNDGLISVNCCRNTASFILRNPTNIGGIIGSTIIEMGALSSTEVNIHVYNCVNSGNLYANIYQTCYIGGIVGGNGTQGWTIGGLGLISTAPPLIHNCINNGDINDDTDSNTNCYGGIVGYNYNNNTEITCCANGGSIKKGRGIGGHIYGTYQECWDYAGSASVPTYTTEYAKITNCGSKNASDLVTYMNNYIQSSGTSSIYKSWKLTDNGKCDLDF